MKNLLWILADCYSLSVVAGREVMLNERTLFRIMQFCCWAVNAKRDRKYEVNNMRIYLDVPYDDKEEAKSLGAKWNPRVKKWYAETRPEEYVKFSKWILKDTDDAIIATEYLHIIEGRQNCWRCGKETRVIGLGIGEYIHIYDDGDGPEYEIVEDCIDPGEEIHLAWVDSEDDIPPKLLRYMKANYSVKTGYSKTAGKCFANHCDHCGALQGNWYLFDEPDSPLSSCVDGNELIQRMSKLKIIGIPIEDDLNLNWMTGFCCNDYAYIKYGEFEELVLSSDPNNDYVTYEELSDAGSVSHDEAMKKQR